MQSAAEMKQAEREERGVRVQGKEKQIDMHQWSVVAQPVVSLTEVIKEHTRTIGLVRGQQDGRRAVRFCRHPCTVKGIKRKKQGEEKDDR